MPDNATAEIVGKVVLERLADDLEELDMLVNTDGADVARVRELAGESLMLTFSLLEAA